MKKILAAFLATACLSGPTAWTLEDPGPPDEAPSLTLEFDPKPAEESAKEELSGDIAASQDSSTHTPEPSVYPQWRQEAQTALTAGKWRRARRLAKKAISRKKKTPEAWVVLGRAYMQKRRYRKANRRFKKALKYAPLSGEAYYWRGVNFERWEKLAEALNEFQAATRADPDLFMAKEAEENLRAKISNALEGGKQ